MNGTRAPRGGGYWLIWMDYSGMSSSLGYGLENAVLEGLSVVGVELDRVFRKMVTVGRFWVCVNMSLNATMCEKRTSLFVSERRFCGLVCKAIYLRTNY